MATLANATSALEGISEQLISKISSIAALSLIILIPAAFFALVRKPEDPRTPPIVQSPSRIPFVGHLIGLLYHGNHYPRMLQQQQPVAIGTLPVLGSSLTFIWSPTLIQSALTTSKSFGLADFTLISSGTLFQETPAYLAALKGENGGPDNSTYFNHMIGNVRESMRGADLRRMNSVALEFIEGRINAMGAETHIADLFEWCSEIITRASTATMYGSKDPFVARPELRSKTWEFDDNIMSLVFPGVLPTIFARRAYRAREEVQAALVKYLVEDYDVADDCTAPLTKSLTEMLPEYGLTRADFGRAYFQVLWVSIVNTAPTLFWMLAHIWTREDILEPLRDEVRGIIDVQDGDGKRKAVVDITRFEEQCPLLFACFREVLRLGGQSIAHRFVLKDTVVTDSDGSEYFLKKGTHVMWGTKMLHRSEGVWGADALQFNPRHMTTENMGGAQRQSFIPFGGGKHLCPGRQFAMAEILGLIVVLVTGFVMEGLSEQDTVIPSPPLTAVVAKPTASQGKNVKLRRREGWEDVEWTYKCE
jgi:cytochrome P450